MIFAGIQFLEVKKVYLILFNSFFFQVQMLVEKDKNLDLRYALQLAANVQPIETDSSIISDVSNLISCVCASSIKEIFGFSLSF